MLRPSARRRARSSPASQLGSRLQPERRMAALSSTELAGRGAGRGGSRSLVEIGSTRGGSRPAALSTRRANSYQVVEPWLVTWNDAGMAPEGELDDPFREVGGRGRAARAGRRRNGALLPARARRSTVFDHVAPGPAVHPRRANDRVSGVELALAAELGAPVDRQRVGVVPFDVGPGRGAVEDVVGRQVAEVCSDEAGGLGDVAGAEGVDR